MLFHLMILQYFFKQYIAFGWWVQEIKNKRLIALFVISKIQTDLFFNKRKIGKKNRPFIFFKKKTALKHSRNSQVF